MLPVSGGLKSKRFSSLQIGAVGSFPISVVSMPSVSCGKRVSNTVPGSASHRHRQLMEELKKCFGTIGCSVDKFISWPEEVKMVWKSLNGRKSGRDIGFLTWNVNGRLDLRGCRESLLRRWVMGGSVDIVMIQEHFQKGSTGSINFLSPDWWHVSSDAVGQGFGRKSGGCAVLVQPCIVAGGGFTHPGGRICGVFVGEGLIVALYFPTISSGQSREEFLETFSLFIDQLILVINDKIAQHPVGWIVCGSDTNAHFKGTGRPPRRKDDFAAMQVRRFMKKFDLVSLSEKLCPSQFTFLNSRVVLRVWTLIL